MAGSNSGAGVAAKGAIDRAKKQERATGRPARVNRGGGQARKDRNAGSTTHTLIPMTRGPYKMDRGAMRKASHKKPVRPSRAKGTPCGKSTRSHALGDMVESALQPIFASCLPCTLSTPLTKRPPSRSQRTRIPVLREHETCSQASDARQIKAFGSRASARFNQSQPLATGSPLSSRSLRLSVHCVGICHPRRPGGPLEIDYTTQAPGGRKPKDHRF